MGEMTVSTMADSIRAQNVRTSMADKWRSRPADGLKYQRDGYTLRFTEQPKYALNQRDEIVGVECMVRLFDGRGAEVRIDPHRVIINPPQVPRANLTYEAGTIDRDGKFVGTGVIVAQKTTVERVAYRRIVGSPNPAAAFVEAVFDSVLSVPNAKGFGTRGTVTTVFATAPGGAGSALSLNSVYATARTGGTLGTVGVHRTGQELSGSTYTCYEAFAIFDTSGLPDTDDVSDVVLSLDGSNNSSTTDFVATAASDAYNGGAVVTGDWVSGANLAAKTTYATWNSSGYSAGYNAFTSAGAAFNSAINKTGNTAMIIYSDRHSAGTTPTTLERVDFVDADAAGTTEDPKLDITHAAPSAAITGTATAAINESDVVAGGKTIIITLTGDTWIAAGALSFDLQRQAIIDGLDSAQAEALGWNLQVRDLEVVTAVVRTSDTVVTITLTASPLYNITAQEVITVTVPGAAVVLGNAITATPTFTVDIVSAGSGALVGGRLAQSVKLVGGRLAA